MGSRLLAPTAALASGRLRLTKRRSTPRGSSWTRRTRSCAQDLVARMSTVSIGALCAAAPGGGSRVCAGIPKAGESAGCRARPLFTAKSTDERPGHAQSVAFGESPGRAPPSESAGSAARHEVSPEPFTHRSPRGTERTWPRRSISLKRRARRPSQFRSRVQGPGDIRDIRLVVEQPCSPRRVGSLRGLVG